MAAAGDGRPASSSAYEGGGAGGKFRRRPFRKNQTTPYDRPPNDLRNPSWLTKLVVDPATKLITSGARRFFSSIFQKRLTPAPTPLPLPPMPLPPPPEARQESKDVQQESCLNDHAGPVVATGHEVCKVACSSEDGAFSEFEQLLKQKTFSRDEIDRLTELLRSKAVDTPAGNDKGAVATPVTSSRVPKGNVASAAELAKAYMDTRPSKVSPTILSSQSQVVRVDTPVLKSVAYSQNLPIAPVTTKTAGLVGVRANGFTPPRSRGRSAIYHMARTPYSRLRLTDGQMASSSTHNAYSGPSLSESVLEHDGYFGSKQPLKRRSSALEDDIGSVGPIRRTRQKPNLLSHGISRPNLGGVASAAADVPTRYAHISSDPSETAAKILEHLENLTPKEKSSESRLTAGSDKTPKKLSPNMLRGQALKSLESLDSPKLLQSAQDSHKLENWSEVIPTNDHDSSLQKQGVIEQHRQNKSINRPTVVPKKNEKNSFEDAQPGVETADSLDKKSSVQPQKKHAFRMSALEDSFEMDEDINFDNPASQLAEGRDKMGISGAEKKSLSTDEALNKKPAALSETNATLGILNKRNDMKAPDAALISISSPSFLSSSDSQSPEVVAPSFGLNKSKESSGDKVPALLFSSSFPLSGLKPESSSSLSNPAFGLAGASLELFESDNSQKDGKSNEKSEPLSSGLSPSPLFAAPSSTSTFSNGQFAPSPAISAFSLLDSSNSPKDVQSYSSSEVAHSTSISAAVGGGLFGFAAASSVSTEPLIKSGPSEVPSMVSKLLTASTADNADLQTKAANSDNLSSSSPFAGSSFASTSPGNSIFGFSSSGMSTVTTASDQSQSSVFSTGAQSLVSAQTSLTGSDNTRVSQSVPAHFGSSTTSPVVGNSRMTSFSSVGSASSNTGIVSAAASDSNPVGSSAAAVGNFGFGASSSTSSTLSSSVGPSSGTSQLSFTFGASPAVHAATTALATSSNATSAIFSFGNDSSSSLANAVDTSTRPSPSTFNFGGSSSASSLKSVGMSNSAAPGIFSFGGGSSASSTNAVGTSTNATPVFSFGGGSSAPSTNTISTSTNATPGVFSFGGGSSASSTNTVSTSTNATPGVFSLGGGSSASSTNTVSTSTNATPGVFSFGGGSSASSTNTVSTSTNATPGVFSFGGNSLASPTNTVSTSTSATTGIFNFGASSSVLSTNTVSTSTSAAPGVFSFGASSSVPSTNTVSTSTSAAPGVFSFGASSSVLSTNAVNASSTVSPSPFAFGASSTSSQTSSAAGILGSNWQAPKSPGFSSPFSSATPTAFAFGASSSSFTPPATTAAVFGSAPSTPTGPAFPFGSTSLTNPSTQSIFGNSTSPFTASPGNNNQMNMEDSMAEDTMHASSPAVAFGQPSVSPTPGGFMFGSTPNPFQFGGQQNQAAAAAQNPCPFAASSSLGAGGSFSLGSNGPDKSGRKIVKINRNKNRRK
ncbi:nuclear pore complex protein NUP1-like [Solanum lycopersicum]|uniref:nuclear pore complex protein NUP1-like n=1 Tax=Solanum lycopersicum TaxID=4081 RepID=UPI0002BC7FAF|nr:nuclear pore complex protein NUP1-like [Solanum lycopersicum]